MTEIRNFNEIRGLLADLPAADEAAAAKAEAREPQLTKPQGALGHLEAIAEWLSAWQGRHPPAVERTGIVVFAGSHGVTAEGVSAFPAEVTAQMVANFEAGGAAINQLAEMQGAELRVRALDVGTPTANFLAKPAMSETDCAAAFAAGMEAVEEGWDALAVGEMGIGNTTSAAAICRALFGGTAEDWVGPGTGVAGEALANKVRVVEQAVVKHGPELTDGLEVLRHLGGREIAALAGAVVAARRRRVPVVLDGYVTCAAAAVLHAMDGTALDHCVVGHVSAEPGHRLLLQELGKRPLLDLGMRLGEGSGAALALGILKAAAACHGGMATFGEAGVSDRD